MAGEEIRRTSVEDEEGKAGGREGSAESRANVRGWILLVVLTLYVVLLGIGTVAEAFDIEWILKWPIY